MERLQTDSLACLTAAHVRVGIIGERIVRLMNDYAEGEEAGTKVATRECRLSDSYRGIARSGLLLHVPYLQMRNRILCCRHGKFTILEPDGGPESSLTQFLSSDRMEALTSLAPPTCQPIRCGYDR